MAADGYIRIDTKINQAGAQTGLASLTKSLKGFAVAAGLAFGVAAITNFAKSCISLASDLAEVQNVVDVTFGSSAQKINDFAKTAATGFGLSQLAAKQYTGTVGAMFKSMGFTADAAADMSIELAKLSGDMASFYNLSTDEAFQKIRAGISGETEPLKQLGVNLSEANLKAYALAQGITQDYSAMTEQNKALIRYNYLLDVTKDAQGDFARTSGSWANQVRVLQLQWDSLKATLGGSFIAVLTPVLAFINRILGALSAAATLFASFISMITGTQQSVATGAAAASGAMDDVTDSTTAAGNAAGSAGKKAKKGLAAFDELNVLPDSSGGGGGGGGGVDLTPAKSSADETTTAMDKAKNKMTEFFLEYKDRLLDIKEKWSTLSTTASEFWAGLKKQAADTDIGGAAFELLLSIVQAVLGYINLIAYYWSKMILAFNVPATIESALRFLTDVFDAIGAAIDAVTPAIEYFIDVALAPIVAWIGEKVRDAMAFLGDQFKIIGAWFTEHKEDFTVIGQYISDIAAAIWKVLAPLLDAGWEIAKATIGTMIQLLLEFAGWALEGAVWLIESWGKIKEKAVEVFGSVSEFLSKTWEDIKLSVTTKWGEITGLFTTAWANIKLVFAPVAQWFTDNLITPLTKPFTDFQTLVSGIFTGIGNSAKSALQGIINGAYGMVNGMIGAINLLINRLNGLSIKVPDIFGGGTAGFNITPLQPIPVPQLAQGAVIPPNREFAAILGDQKRGINIETPLATMIDAFKTALLDMGASSGSSQPITINIETTLDGKTVARNQVKYLPAEYDRVGPSAVKVGA